LVKTVLKYGEKLDQVNKKTTEMHEALIGNLHTEGIVGCVNRHGRDLAALDRLKWIFIGSGVVLILGGIYTAIV